MYRISIQWKDNFSMLIHCNSIESSFCAFQTVLKHRSSYANANCNCWVRLWWASLCYLLCTYANMKIACLKCNFLSQQFFFNTSTHRSCYPWNSFTLAIVLTRVFVRYWTKNVHHSRVVISMDLWLAEMQIFMIRLRF